MNSFDRIDPVLVDQFPADHDGYPVAFEAEDTTDALWDVCGDASREFPEALWIEPEDWEDAARDCDKHKTWALNFCDRFTNQTPNHFCTCHSLGTNYEICRNRARGVIFPEGPKKAFRYSESAEYGSVWVSPMSIYAEANPREWGGASIRQVMEICIRRGFLPDRTQPREYGFKHTLTGTTGKGGLNQSSGPWIAVSRFPDGWQDTAKHFRVNEVIFPTSAEQIMCLVLRGYSVCVGRQGHAVPYSLANVKDRLVGYIDSYDVIRWDSWRTVQSAVSGSYAIASVTTPSDWLKPTG